MKSNATWRVACALAVSAGVALVLASCSAVAPTALGVPTGNKAVWSGPTGSATITVVWPEVVARVIPTATERITLELSVADTGEPLTDLPGMNQLPLERPGPGQPVRTTVTISQIPAVPVAFSAAAFSATGEALAAGASTVTILPGVAPTAVQVSLDRRPLPPPANLTATAAGSAVNLSWQAPATGRVSGYDVYRGTTSGAWPDKRNTSLVTSATYTDSSLTSGTTYYYVVRAVEQDGEGRLDSPPSNECVVTPAGSGGGGLANSPWPKFHGNARNTGLSPYIGAQTATRRWAFGTGASVQSSPALGADGTVYVANLSYMVYALDGSTGARKWQFGPGAGGAGSPAIGGDGTVYIGGHDHSVYAIDGTTGAEKWRFPTGGEVRTGLTIGTDGTVYVGSFDGNVYAIDGATGLRRWAFPTGNSVQSGPALGADGTVYIGSDDHNVYALDGATGAEKWWFATGGYVYSHPAIGTDGTIYVGSSDGKVYARDGATGARKWEFPTGAGVYGSPGIGPDGTVYIGSYDRSVYAIDGVTGAKRWQFTTGHWVYSSPAIGADGTVYIGSDDGYIYALNGATGGLKWQFATGGYVISSPAIGADGTIYVGSDDGSVYAIGDGGAAAPPRIVFTSARTGNYEVWAVNPDGSGLEQITHDGVYAFAPRWSPDYHRIAWTSSRYGGYQICTMDAHGSDISQVTSGPEVHNMGGWSPDGQTLVFEQIASSQRDVYAVNQDGTGLRPVAASAEDENQPSWSPDGQFILYTRSYAVWRVASDGSGARSLRSGCGSPASSPDGTTIAYAVWRGGIWTMSADGGDPRQLTAADWSADDDAPSWSPDGTHIVFSRVADGNRELYVMRADGTEQTRITWDPAEDNAPCWAAGPP